METPYTVPEIARLTGIPETTLYDYVRQFSDIVPEVETAEENGRSRRRYPEQAITVFQTIRHLKDRGVDLPTIRALLQDEQTPESHAAAPIPADALETLREAGSALMDRPAPATETGPEVEPGVATESESVAPAAEEATVDAEIAADEETHRPATITGEEAISAGRVAEYPFFEAPPSEPAASVSVGTVTPLQPTIVVEPESATAAEPSPLASTTARPVVDGEIILVQNQLLCGLEESLHSLRALMEKQNGENQRLSGELKEQRDENERLRATIRYQKEQARVAERLLGAIKSQCEQGIQSIAE